MKEIANKEDLAQARATASQIRAEDLDLAATLFADVLSVMPLRHRQALAGRTRPSDDIAAIGQAWRDQTWRATHASWDAYLAAEHGIVPRRPSPTGPDRRAVYFIQADGGPIKIGVAAHPSTRLADLQTASPNSLRLMATIPDQGAAGEAALHERFAHLRVRGEWFEPAPELLAHIHENGVLA